jgi:uncharacterized protein (DUF4415 family)
MTKSATIVRSTLAEAKARIARGQSQTRPDAPEAEDDLPEEFWQNAVVRRRLPKKSVHLRLDADVLDWFKSQGAGHLTRMNDVLAAYAAAKMRKAG